MTTVILSHENAASKNVYVRIFGMEGADAGKVYDFDDDTFKALASCTTPYKVATEQADMNGTGFSGYLVSIDCALINNTSTLKQYSYAFFDNASPADADVAISGHVGLAIVKGSPFVSPSILSVAMTESYAAQGAVPTLEQAIFEILQTITEATNSGTTRTVKKRDRTTTAVKHQYDAADYPNSVTRAP